MKIPYIDLHRWHQELKPELMEAFSRTIDHGGFCLGKEVDDFEKAFASEMGASRCVAVGSGTEALHLTALALGIGPGDEIIIPSFTFIASAWFAQYVGAKIVFADIDPATYTINPDCIEALITDRTKAIVAVHLYGQPANVDPILKIAAKHGLKVVEDAAQACFAEYKGKSAGLVGDAGTFSFYPSKALGALGEGGCVVSNDEELLERVSILRVHGSKERYYSHYIGYNNRMEGLQAASLNVKLPKIRSKIVRRQEIARRYIEEIDPEKFQVPLPVDWGASIYSVFTILCQDREALRSFLSEKGIGTDIVYPVPLHRQPCFAELGYRDGDFPHSENAADNSLSLPIYPELRDEEIDYIIDTINSFCCSAK